MRCRNLPLAFLTLWHFQNSPTDIGGFFFFSSVIIFVFWFGSVWGVIYKAEPDYYGAMKRKNICITCIIRILEFESAENAESAAVSAYISVITPPCTPCTLAHFIMRKCQKCQGVMCRNGNERKKSDSARVQGMQWGIQRIKIV